MQANNDTEVNIVDMGSKYYSMARLLSLWHSGPNN